MDVQPQTGDITFVDPPRASARPAAAFLGIHWSAWLLAALAGVLQVVIFPLLNWNFLCWIAVAPLMLALMRARPASTVPGGPRPPSAGNGDLAQLPASATEPNRQSAFGNRQFASVPQGFALAYLAGVIYAFGACYWIYHVMAVYGGLSAPVAALVLVLFCLAWAIFYAAFGFLVAVAAGPLRLGVRAVVLAPMFWVAMEMFRRLSGFPWDPLGTVLVNNIPLSRLATVTGVYGLSFEIVLVNSAFAVAFLVPRRRRALMLATAVIAAAMMQAGAFIEPPPLPADLTARLVQPNIEILDPDVWTRDYLQKTLSQLATASIPKPGETPPGEPLPDLIVWPETPAPFFSTDPLFRGIVSSVARQAHASMIVGMLGLERPGDPNSHLLNSAEFVAPDGAWTLRYDKIHLVPFGEYVPFQSVLSFASKLTREVGDFVPGSHELVMRLPNYTVGTFICYESVYPDSVRRFARNGAQVLVNISDDGWFGDTAAPFQHLNQARMRAIENNRWLLRATDTGHTVSIDPYGRVVASIRTHELNTLDAPFTAISRTTFYTRHGDWFPWACAIISLLVLFAAIARTASKSQIANQPS